MIYLPLEHLEQRYTTHLDRDITAFLDARQIKYQRIEPFVFSNKVRDGFFLDADNTVYRQFYQMQKVIEGLMNGTIDTTETLWVSDIWNFALLAVPYLNYFSCYNLKIRGLLHAGSFTDTDFVRQMERTYKGFEDALLDICDKIYVGSEFIKSDVCKKRFVDAKKIVVTGLPLDWRGIAECQQRNKGVERRNLVVFNGRNVDEKQPYLFDELASLRPQYEYINTQKENLSKQAYYDVMRRAKVVVSFALQENFGYGIQEAVALGCIPVVPNRLAYVEQFPKEYRYDTFVECVDMVDNAMCGKLQSIESSIPTNEQIFEKWFNE